MEAAGYPALKEIAAAASPPLTLLRNVVLEFRDNAGSVIGGQGREIDFLLLGGSNKIEVVSAKLKPGKYEPGPDRTALGHFYNMPDKKPALTTYLQTHFGANKAFPQVDWVNVRWAGGEQRLVDFRARLATSTAVGSIVVTSLTPAPEFKLGHQLRADVPQLLQKVADLVDSHLP